MRNISDMRQLVDRIDLVTDEKELQKVMISIGPDKISRPAQVAFVNAHAFNHACSNDSFRNDLLESDYIFRDGSGMKILYKMMEQDPGLNLNGTDLIPRIIKLYSGRKAALLGTENPYLERAAETFRSEGVEPVLVMDGFQGDEAYLDAAVNTPAPLIILAMGMPKQERVASLLARHLDYPCLIICGGAILDFLGGKVRRAPVAFRRIGMEWLYRFMLEPKRLFRRYMVGNFIFLCRGYRLAGSSKKARAEELMTEG